jgi:molybdate transport system substrate-binding protein
MLKSKFLFALMSPLMMTLGLNCAQADTLKVLTAGAFKQVVIEMVPAFEAQTGHRVEVQNDTAGALSKRLASGEAFDVVIITPGALKPFEANGIVAAGSVKTIAKVAIGVAVKEGAPVPAMQTVDDFKAALQQARKVAYIDPAAGGSSGIYLDQLFKKMGLFDMIQPKAVLVPGGLVADRLVSDQADLAIHQISEILPVRGAHLVAPLPEAIQNYTVYAAALSGPGARRKAAQDLLNLLASSAARDVIKSKGMMPMD